MPALNFITAGFKQLKAEGFLEEEVPHQALSRLLWGALLEAGVYISPRHRFRRSSAGDAPGVAVLVQETPGQALVHDPIFS